MSNLDVLRHFISHAPKKPNHKNVLAGVTGDGFTICADCMSRIQGRGCTIPKPHQVIWPEQGPVNCDLQEFHNP